MRFRLGCLIQCIFWSLLGDVVCMAITIFIRKMERGWPILTYSSIALQGGGYVLLHPDSYGLGVSSRFFRPESLEPGGDADHERLGVVRLPVHLAAVSRCGWLLIGPGNHQGPQCPHAISSLGRLPELLGAQS